MTISALTSMNTSAGLGLMRERYSAQVRELTRSAATLETYRKGQAHLERWAERFELDLSLGVGELDLLRYLHYWGNPSIERHGDDPLLAPSTLGTYLAGIRWAHLQEGRPWIGDTSDSLSETMDLLAVLQRDRTRTPKGKALVEPKLLAAVRNMTTETPAGVRNRALLLVGFYAALRREELVALRVEDITVVAEEDDPLNPGILVRVRSSKTDRRGSGIDIAVSRTWADPDPVSETQRWLEARGAQGGPLFTNIAGRGPRSQVDRFEAGLSGKSVGRILKSAVNGIGEDPERYSAHSLRAGFITSAALAGVEPRLIKEQSRHRSYDMVDRYIHAATSLRDNAVRKMHPRG